MIASSALKNLDADELIEYFIDVAIITTSRRPFLLVERQSMKALRDGLSERALVLWRLVDRPTRRARTERLGAQALGTRERTRISNPLPTTIPKRKAAKSARITMRVSSPI
jgi:hypothetical protein